MANCPAYRNPSLKLESERMLRFLRVLVILVTVAGCLTWATPAQAGFGLITTRSGTDTIFWGQLGIEFATVSSPSTVTSIGGVAGVVANNGTVQRRNQSSNWNGNFAAGDQLLFQTTSGAAIEVSTTPAMVLAGAQIQENIFGAFSAQVEALDSGGSVLATFATSGTSPSHTQPGE